MSSIGEILKRARLAQGLDLAAVSVRTKISTNYLVAIESDDRKKLPSGFFYKSFVDQYARTLSLDATEINAEVERALAEYAPLPLPGQDHNPIHRVPPISARRGFRRRWPFASVASLILVVFGCSAVYAWWHNGKLPLELPQFLNLQKAPDVVEAAKQPEITIPAETPVSLPAEPETPRRAPEAVAPVAPADPAPVQVHQPPPSKSKLLLDLIATEKTWLSVSSDGKPVFSGVLAPRQSKKITGRKSAKLTIGNAAGLQVRLNGKALGRLGQRGQVLVVLFTPDNFRILLNAKEGD